MTFASLSFPSFLLRFVAPPLCIIFFSRAHLRESKVRTPDPKIILLAASGETFPFSPRKLRPPLLAKNSGKEEEEETPIRLSPSFPEKQRVFFLLFYRLFYPEEIVYYSWACKKKHFFGETC